MNEAALKSMAKMIQVMLPYETNYEPTETSTQALREIVDVLRESNPKVNEFLGFINYIFKQMDASEDTGKFDRALMRVWAIIHKHYPPIKSYIPPDGVIEAIAGDDGEDDSEHQMYPQW